MNQVVADGIDDTPRHLAAGRAVEKDRRLSKVLPRQARELRTNRGYIEGGHARSSRGTFGCTYLGSRRGAVNAAWRFSQEKRAGPVREDDPFGFSQTFQ